MSLPMYKTLVHDNIMSPTTKKNKTLTFFGTTFYRGSIVLLVRSRSLARLVGLPDACDPARPSRDADKNGNSLA